MTTVSSAQAPVCEAEPLQLDFEDGDRLGSQHENPFRDAEVAEFVHDVRNTLAAVRMLSDLMLRDLPEESPVRGIARDVRMACNDANSQCERMLASSRGSCHAGERTDLSNLVTRMGPLLAMWVSPASSLRFDLAAHLPPLDCAPDAVHQIVMNLVKNAAEALGDRPGVVTVSTGRFELGSEDVNNGNGWGALRPGRHLCLAVSDTGCGLDEPTRARLLQESSTTKTNGNGLGLASVRRIAAAHGAGLQLESRVGVGTTVRVVFCDAPPLDVEHASYDNAAPDSRIGLATTTNTACDSRRSEPDRPREHLAESQNGADHDLDVVDELSRRLDGLPRFDEFIDNARGQPCHRSVWRELQAQELAGIERLKALLPDKIRAACF